MHYFWYHYKKIALVSLTFLVVGFLGFWLLKLMDNPEPALARNLSYPNLQGWAWCETFGWISLNCTDLNSCGDIDYGVYYNTDTNRFGGYAWSENFGWLDFSNSNTITLSGSNLNGSAQVVSLGGTDGELKLNDDNLGDGINYGVSFVSHTMPATLDEGTVGGYGDWGDLRGWAWNGGDLVTKKGLGWVSFNCLEGGNCGTVNYKVVGRPDNIGIAVAPTEGNESTSLTVFWNSNILGVQSFKIWRRDPEADPAETDLTWRLDITNQSASSYVNDNLDNYKQYDYLVMACNVFGCDLSNIASARTSPMYFNLGDDLKTSGVCIDEANPNTSYVDLEWPRINRGSGWSGVPDHYQVQLCVLEQGQDITDCDSSALWSNLVDVTYDSNENPVAYRDILNSGNGRYADRFNLHAYRVRAVSTAKVCEFDVDTVCNVDADCAPDNGSCLYENSSWLVSSRLVRPCPRRTQPEYNETRPQ